MTTPLLSVDALHVTAPNGAHLLRGVGLTLQAGRFMGLVGESGSGKSTLGLALLGLLAPTLRLEGRLTLEGAPYDPVTNRGRRLAMIFQDPATALHPLFTIGTLLDDVLRRREPGLPRAGRRARIHEALARVELPDPPGLAARYPHQLSGGMRQRVMIAMALLAGPDLLVADEPTTALDATVEAGILALFARLRTQGALSSMLLVSHHLALVAATCDDLAVMYAGRIMETGPAAAVAAAPAHPYTAALLACDPARIAPGAPVPSIPGEVPDPRDTPPGCLFAPRCTQAGPRCHAEPQTLRPLPAEPSHHAACWRATG